MKLNQLRKQYIEVLTTDFIPFWEKAIDNEYGGVFTCFSNDGTTLVSEDKYTWSQGRFLWLTEALLSLKNQGLIELSEIWETNFKKTYHFLVEHTMMENGHIVFAVTKDGKKIDGQKDTSIFADCFFVLGLSAYARYYQDSNAFNTAYQTYEKIQERIKTGNYRSEPYPVNEHYTSHSIPMILINVSEDLYVSAQKLNAPQEKVLKKKTNDYLNQILDLTTDERIIEMKHTNPAVENMLTTHLNPGHTMESIWFMIHSMKRTNYSDYEIVFQKLEKIAINAVENGWDEVHGGLFRFVHKDGGEPRGELENSILEKLIQDTWDMKLWWPHSEALDTTLLIYMLTKENKWLNIYKQIEEYVFNTFPNENKQVGEWIQIRNREGKPEEKVVALPVKDPFHIIRNFVLIIRLLGDDYVTWNI